MTIPHPYRGTTDRGLFPVASDGEGQTFILAGPCGALSYAAARCERSSSAAPAGPRWPASTA